MKFNRKILKRALLVTLTLICMTIITVNGISLDYDLKISSVKYQLSGNVINGSFVLKNNLYSTYKDLFLKTSIYYEDPEGNINLINQNLTELIVEQQTTRLIDFTHEIPATTPGGSYLLILDINNRAGINIAKSLTEFILNHEQNDFLIFNSKTAVLQSKTGDVPPLSGPNFEPGEIPKLKFTLKNIGNSLLGASLRGKVYMRDITYNPQPVYNEILTTVNFNAGENKDLIVELPPMKQPESYYIVMNFESDKGSLISGAIEARYVIKGVSSKIIFCDVSIENEKIKVTGELSGPADGSSLEGVIVKASVIDSKTDSDVLRKEETIDLSSNIVPVSFESSIDKSVTNMKVKLDAFYDGKLLDSITKDYTNNQIEVHKENNQLLFSDISDYKFKDSINALALAGMLKGYPDGTFKPTNNMTRAESAAILCYVMGMEKEAKSINVTERVFNDLKSDPWAVGFIKVLKDKNYIKGYPDGSFRAQENLNYAQAITVLVKKINDGNDIPSVQIWYDGYLKKASELGITEDITVVPYGYITRGEFAHLIFKVLSKFPK